MPDSAEQILRRLGDRVRAERKARGWPRNTLSDRSGISPRYLAQLESGQGNISVALLSKVAHALDTELHVLLGAAPEPITQLYKSAPLDIRVQVDRLLTTPSRQTDRVCLIGLRGAGKSTLGARLADAMGRPFVELSREITQIAGLPMTEIMALYGPEGFRDLEAQALDQVIAHHPSVVLAVAGGIATNADTFGRLLGQFYTVWLRALPQEHMARVKAQGDMRPMAGNPQAMDQLKSILAQRTPQYARAHAQLQTSGQSVSQSAQALIGLVTSPGQTSLA